MKTCIDVLERRSRLLFGWLLLATSVGMQAQFDYTNINGTITITGYTGNDPVVSIPSTLDGRPVTAIGNAAFTGLYQIPIVTSITIPNTVISIEGGAFYACHTLTNVTIPNSVTSIGSSAFGFCTSLSSVTIPNTVTNIGDFAFGGCVGLTVIGVKPNNPAYSSVDGVLFNQRQSTLIQYPAGKVDSYLIPDSVTRIEDNAFSYSSLTNIIIPNSVTSIGDSAFFVCSGLTSVTIPDGVTSIGDSAFAYCSGLTSVTIPKSVTSIATQTFEGCASLTSITIPNSITSIGVGAFGYCTNLASITVPDSVTDMGDGVFYSCRSLTSVIIGNSVTNIGAYAFRDCTSLTNIIIPNSVTSIGAQIFGGCISLTEITLGSRITNVGVSALENCFSLTSVYFRGNAPGQVGRPFFDGTNSPTIYYLPGTTGWGSTFDGIPTAVWSLPYPLILNSSLGVRTNEFGFTVSWATNLSVVVEAASDLANPVWSPVATNALTSGSFNFSDPQWKGYRKQFYRVRVP